MQIVKVKALDAFSHGRLHMERGGTANINSYDADDLERARLVEIIGEADPDELDDVLGQKMEPMSSNKMDNAPENKKRK